MAPQAALEEDDGRFGSRELGSEKAAVGEAYPDATPNNGEAVQGYDLFAGARPDLRYTRFATPGIGATPTKLRYIELSWDSCHLNPC